MAAYPQWLLLPSLFIVLTRLLPTVSAESSCMDNGNYTSNSTYKANLDSLLSSLPANIGQSGFHNSSEGRDADRVYAAVLCRADIQLDRCRACINEATKEAANDCPNQNQVAVFLEYCTLRYSSESMFGHVATSPSWRWWNTENASDPGQFNRDLRTLLDDLRGKAVAGGSLWKVATGNTSSDFATIYSMLQCSPDLSSSNCGDCLSAAVEYIRRRCDGKIGCRVVMPTCFIRYETYSFYNDTRLQELQAPAVVMPSTPPDQLPRPDPGNKDSSSRTINIIVVSVVGSSLLLAICVGTLLMKRSRMRKRPRQVKESIHDIEAAESLQYDFEEIKRATNDFAEENKVGQGGFGAVYKGRLANGQDIAVKRLSQNSGQGQAEFKNEVVLISKLQHRNLVRLLGFSLEGDEKLIVYEFVQNASLDKFIFDPNKRSQLNWEKRYKIILGIARGLLYLHEDSRIMIIHRDLKAGNILLDLDMNPKIADFGMARLLAQDATQCRTDRIVGTYGYMAPEYAMQGFFSAKSDVFSFGVLILEIICGQKNNSFHIREIHVDIITFAWTCWSENTAANMIDSVLKIGGGYPGDILRCIHIALLCVQEDATQRPTMASVLLMLGSSSITLPAPSESAFCASSCDDSNASHVHDNSRDLTSKSTDKSLQY